MQIDPAVLKALIEVLKDYKNFPDKKISPNWLIDYLERVLLRE